MDKLIIKRTRRGYSLETYEISGDISAYSDTDLLNLCDRNNFGGEVRRYSDGATVTVYID